MMHVPYRRFLAQDENDLKSGAINMTANVRSTKRRTLRQIVFVLAFTFATCNKVTVNIITGPTLQEHQLLHLVSIVDPGQTDRTYLWRRDAEEICDSSQPSVGRTQTAKITCTDNHLIVRNLSSNDAGQYSCSVPGVGDSDSVAVVVTTAKVKLPTKVPPSNSSNSTTSTSHIRSVPTVNATTITPNSDLSKDSAGTGDAFPATSRGSAPTTTTNGIDMSTGSNSTDSSYIGTVTSEPTSQTIMPIDVSVTASPPTPTTGSSALPIAHIPLVVSIVAAAVVAFSNVW